MRKLFNTNQAEGNEGDMGTKLILMVTYWQLLSVCYTKLLVGASLSEPTLAGLYCTDVCVYDWPCLQPYTVNFKCAFKYFLKIERPRALAWQCWAAARVQRWQPLRRRLKFKDARHLISGLSQQLRTNHQRQAARRPYKIIHSGLRSLQVRVVHKWHS